MTRRKPGEGSIRQRTDGRWEALLSLGSVDGRRQRLSFVHRDYSEVERRLNEAREARAGGGLDASPDLTVGDLLRQWLDRARRKVRPNTYRGYEQVVRTCLVPELGHLRLTDLSPQQVEALLNREHQRGLSALTVRQHRNVLSAALNLALRWGLIARNAASLADPPPLNRREVTPVGPEEARRVLEAIRGHRHEALYAISLTVGLRQSEGLGLRWSDVDVEGRSLAIRQTLHRVGGKYVVLEPKTKRSARSVDLPDPIWELLKAHRERQDAEREAAESHWVGDAWGGLVFASRLGAPLHGRVVAVGLKRRLRRAGLPPMRFHDLRHAAATLMLALGIPLLEVSRVLGHSQTSTTLDIYSHATPRMRTDARERLTAAFSPIP